MFYHLRIYETNRIMKNIYYAAKIIHGKINLFLQIKLIYEIINSFENETYNRLKNIKELQLY